MLAIGKDDKTLNQAVASRTAMRVAILRAAHQLLDGEPKILVDPIAVGLIPEASERALRADAHRLQEPRMRRLRANFVLRSRFAEDRLEAAARRGVTQYVVLGAGLDTFAYRQPNWADGMTIVEVDHPASQQFKIASLKSTGVIIPGNVEFFPIEFEHEDLAKRLADAPLNRAKAIFISWLGVTQYLTRNAIGATLRSLSSWIAGSEIALTYILDDWSSMDADERAAMDGAQMRAAASGEPWLSKFSPSDIADLLSQSGFARIEPFTIEEARRRYFRNRGDNLQPSAGTGLVWAAT